MRIDILIFLPNMQFLHEGSGLIFSALYGLLQGSDDSWFFMLDFGFLGKDDRVYRFGILYNRFYIASLAGLKNGCEISPAGVDIILAAIVVINDL